MSQQELDARQSILRDLVTELADGVANKEVDDLLRSADRAVTRPLRMRVVSTATLAVDTHLVQNPETNRYHTIAPINNLFTAPTYPVVVTVPASNGGNITNTTGSPGVALNIPTNLDYAWVGLAIANTGQLAVAVGAPGPVIASLAYPVFPNGKFAIGQFLVQRNGAGFSALTGSGIYQFDGGIAAAILNPMTTTGDLIYSQDNFGTPQRLGIGTTGQLMIVTAGLPAWTDTIATAKTFSSDATVLGQLKVGTSADTSPFVIDRNFASYIAFMRNSNTSSAANGLNLQLDGTDPASLVQNWQTGAGSAGAVTGAGRWTFGLTGSALVHTFNGQLLIQSNQSADSKESMVVNSNWHGVAANMAWIQFQNTTTPLYEFGTTTLSPGDATHPSWYFYSNNTGFNTATSTYLGAWSFGPTTGASLQHVFRSGGATDLHIKGQGGADLSMEATGTNSAVGVYMFRDSPATDAAGWSIRIGENSLGSNYSRSLMFSYDSTLSGALPDSDIFSLNASITSPYTARLVIDDTGVKFGHDSASRILSLFTNNSQRLNISATGNVSILTGSLQLLNYQLDTIDSVTPRTLMPGKAGFIYTNQGSFALTLPAVGDLNDGQLVFLSHFNLSGGGFTVSAGSGTTLGTTSPPLTITNNGIWLVFVGGSVNTWFLLK